MKRNIDIHADCALFPFLYKYKSKNNFLIKKINVLNIFDIY